MTTTTNTDKTNGHLYVVSYTLEDEETAVIMGFFTNLERAQVFVAKQSAMAKMAHLSGLFLIAENVATDNIEDVDHYAVISKDDGIVRYYATSAERDDVDHYAGCLALMGRNVSVRAYSTEKINTLPF